ncbi:MAG: efflux RND transporter periplasmic adaptor subunit [Candidatus Hinthialibacter antarcticus]|nr:efflux RND transporter periplasmic adaptor subunit [Candidatus Hinthialibacter antarcticus]
MIRIIRTFIHILTPLVVIAVGAAVAYWLITHRPHAQKTLVEPPPTLVDVFTAHPSDETVVIEVSGTVIPAQEVDLRPQVTGKIIEQSSELMPGGRFRKDDVMLRIEPEDYEYIIEQQKARVELAQLNLLEEQGRQTIAEREWKLLGNDVPQDDVGRDLALRKPHIKNAKAALLSAQSSLNDAKLQLKRTVIRAPFNAFVKNEFVDIGQLANSQTRIATLIGTDEVWVEASVPVTYLPWIKLPERDGSGSTVTVVHDAGALRASWQGRVIRLMGALSEVGRTAKVLISVNDPLNLAPDADNEKMPLLVDTYVQIQIEGKQTQNVFALPEIAIRQDDQGGDSVWVMDANNRLSIRKIHILLKQEKYNLVREGLQDGDRIIISRLGTPLPGMKLRTQEMKLEGDAPPIADVNQDVDAQEAGQ